MPKEVRLMIMIKRTGAHIKMQVTKKTTIKEMIEYVCRVEGVQSERYQLVVNDARVLNESQTVGNEGLLSLKPTDKIFLAMKASYLYLELQALARMKEQRIMALIAKNKGKAEPTVVEPVRTLAEVIKSAENLPPLVPPTISTYSKSIDTEPVINKVLESSTYHPTETLTPTDADIVENSVITHMNEEVASSTPECIEPTHIETSEIDHKEENSTDAVSENPSSSVESVLDYQNVAAVKTEVNTRQSLIIDLEGIAHGIDQFPKGLIQDYVHASLTEFNAMLLGAPGTGKRSLISAICGMEIQRSPSLNDSSVDDSESFTMEHSYQTEKKLTKCNVKFWSTPGITSWSDSNIQKYIDKIKEKKNLMCMIYCASPNSFANPDQIQYILTECVKAGIFSVLVVTNMYAGPASDELLEMFKEMLAVHTQMTEENDTVTYYGNVGLCTKVNSSEFIAQDGEEYPIKGVDELILGISKSLTKDKAIGWGLTIVENGPFWLRKHAKIFNLLDNLKSLIVPNL